MGVCGPAGCVWVCVGVCVGGWGTTQPLLCQPCVNHGLFGHMCTFRRDSPADVRQKDLLLIAPMIFFSFR